MSVPTPGWGALAVSLVIACGGSRPPAPVDNKPTEPATTATSAADDCETFVTKARPIITEMMKAQGTDFTDKDAADMAGECRKDPQAHKDPVFACVLDAADDPAVRACIAKAMKSGPSESGASSPRQTEAAINLNKLAKNLKVYYATVQQFPKGTATQVPAIPCCQQPKLKCAAMPPDPSSIWTTLDFDVEPSFYQLSYESDGTQGVIKAVGDLDCDGTTVEYRLDFNLVDGQPVMKITAPPPNAD